MLQTLKYFLSRVYTITSIVLFALSYGAIQAYAVYYPTDNITNPTCAPGDSGCYVSLLPDQTSKSGSLLFTNGTNPSWTGSSALSWDSVNGRLGVGTSTPTAPLEIVNTTIGNGLRIQNGNTTAIEVYRYGGGAGAGYSTLKFQGTKDIPLPVGNSEPISRFQANAGDGSTPGVGYTAGYQVAGYLGFMTAPVSAGVISPTNLPTDAVIILNAGGSFNNMVERFRVSYNGNIGVGTTTPLSRFHIGVSPTASANYGTLSLGGGAFDGTTSGYFGTSSSSNTNGTSLAINEASGYTGDLINAQIGGSSLLKSSTDSLQVQGSGGCYCWSIYSYR